MSIERLNAEWHNSHRMPKHPTLEQRIEWHVEHAKHCACREMPPAIRALVAARTSQTAREASSMEQRVSSSEDR